MLYAGLAAGYPGGHIGHPAGAHPPLGSPPQPVPASAGGKIVFNLLVTQEQALRLMSLTSQISTETGAAVVLDEPFSSESLAIFLI